MDNRKSEEKRNKKRAKNRSPDKKSTMAAQSPKISKHQLEEQPEEYEHEEEIICDGEIDIQETDCVEIEVGDDNENTVEEANTVMREPSPKPSTSKAARANKSIRSVSNTSLDPVSAIGMPSNSNLNNKKAAKKQRRDSSTSSEEERWLTAIESGKLEDVDDELKKMKDPKLMTARQRAMYERSLDKDAPDSPGGVELLMSLPIGYREKEKPQTAEEIQKAALKLQKRKQQADEKREKDKKKTVDRLLKKQESNKQRAAARNKAAATKASTPMISYRNTPEGACILLPPEHEFPLKAQTEREPPKVQLCGIAGCNNPKIYNCSKTNIPLCSFACYRKNVLSLRQIIF